MVRTARSFFGLFIGLCVTLLILPSCSLFERNSDSPPASDEYSRPSGSVRDSDVSDSQTPIIQTPDQAAAEPTPGAAPVPEAAVKDAEHTPNSEMTLVWGYSGVIGPDTWGKLDPTFKICETGKRQSPIDLKWTKPKKGEITVDYKPTAFSIEDTGRTLQINLKGGNTATIHGSEYKLTHIQFHSSSEHTISGNQLPMEAQLFHKNAKGEVAVLGVILIEGQPNAALEALWSRWPKQKGAAVEVADAKFDPSGLVPEIKTHYKYSGSLTTPPCTEGVNWNVFNTPLELSKAQLLAFRKSYPSNARPAQPLNGRKVTNY